MGGRWGCGLRGEDGLAGGLRPILYGTCLLRESDRSGLVTQTDGFAGSGHQEPQQLPQGAKQAGTELGQQPGPRRSHESYRTFLTHANKPTVRYSLEVSRVWKTFPHDPHPERKINPIHISIIAAMVLTGKNIIL